MRSWAARIGDGVRACLEYLGEHPDAAKAGLVDAAGAGGEVRAARDAAVERFVCFLEERPHTASQCVPKQTAFAVLGAASEVIAAELRCGSATRLTRLAPDLVYVVLLPFVGPETALYERERTAASVPIAGSSRARRRRARKSTPP